MMLACVQRFREALLPETHIRRAARAGCREDPEECTMSARENYSARSVLDMCAKEAREFFLEPESYCKIDLPPYFTFESVLSEVDNYLHDKELDKLCERGIRPADLEGVNYLLLSNKDGRHAWRPFEVIHPVLYVDLVNAITDPENWNFIQERFSQFKKNPAVDCMSIPVKSTSRAKDKEEQIRVWWQEIEQRSIELALEFEVLAHTDINDCYSQIYTHSIAWALHGKETAKKKRRNFSLIGNKIDKCIQNMRHGQTNGIPQGSILMDFIAEMVLGYADLCLSERLEKITLQDKNYKILRYRDDYRIFVRSKYDAEKILKTLTEVLSDLGLKLNSEKTVISDSIIRSSIKVDKLAWLFRVQEADDLEKHSLILHDHARRYPNSGSLLRGLAEFRKKLDKTKTCSNPHVLISIVVDIAYGNPRTYPVCAAIISRLLRFVRPESEKGKIFKKIVDKFRRLPNTGYMEVWLQRIAIPLGFQDKWSERLCLIAEGKEKKSLWRNDWINSDELKGVLNKPIVDEEKKKSMQPAIAPEEYELFLRRY